MQQCNADIRLKNPNFNCKAIPKGATVWQKVIHQEEKEAATAITLNVDAAEEILIINSTADVQAAAFRNQN